MRRREFIALAGACAAWPMPVKAQNWPTRPITMVITYAAGSWNDILGRILAPPLSASLGQQIVVEDVDGAGGMIGAARVARAAPDGYQFVIGGTGTFAANQTLYRKPLYNAATDFTPVVLVDQLPQVLVVRKDLPADNLQEFVAYVNANGARMQYGSAGAGSGSHLACVLLNAAIGANVTHIPYRAAALAMQDLVAGQIDYLCPLISIALPLIQSKQVKAIAITTKNRSPLLPDLASAHEQGLIDFEAYYWDAFFLPKATPAPIVRRLHDATVEALGVAAVQHRVAEFGAALAGPEQRSQEYLQQFVGSEIAKWAGAIRAAGITAD